MPPDYHISRQKALQQYDAAFHLLNVTFPLIKDPKLLMGVINNLSQALEHTMDAILKYERTLRLVPNYLDNFQSKFNLFRYKCVRRNNVPAEHIELIMRIREIQELHKKCPVSFQRGNRYVLCSNDYRLQVISIKEIKKFVNQTNEFIQLSDKIIRIQ